MKPELNSTRYLTLANQTLDWIRCNLTQFALPVNTDENFLRLLKPLGELALASELLVRTKRSEYFERCGREFLQFCWNEFGSGKVLREVLSSQVDLLTISTVYPSFLAVGLRDHLFEQRLSRIVQLRSVGALEFPGWRSLELAITMEELGIDCPWDEDVAFGDSWLSCFPEPWTISGNTGYSLTHTVFYRTRFGRNPESIGEEYKLYLQRWVPVWIEFFIRQANLDLAAELVLVLRCIGLGDGEDDWAEKLCSNLAPNGFLPGPKCSPILLDSRAEHPERAMFVANYHTTLVGLMVGLLSC